MVFVDVGANDGYYTLFAARRVGPSGRVVAAEPSSRERAHLQRNLGRNGLDNVSVVPAAIGAAAGLADLHLAHGVHAGHNTLGRRSMRSSVTSSGSCRARRSVPRRTPGATTPRCIGSSSKPATPTTHRSWASRRPTTPRSMPSPNCIRSSGHELTEAARARVRRAWCRRGCSSTTAPWGVPIELVTGLAEAAAPFSSALVPAGFLTEGVGFGHGVFATTAFDESHRVPHRRRSGSQQSDWLEMELAPGIELEVRFYHCNERHHTLALARAPFELPQAPAPRDVRDERPRRRRRGVRPGVGVGPADPERPRPSRQRRHVQLLRAEPGRLPGRGRPRRPSWSPTTGTTTAATTASARGATSRCASHERIDRRRRVVDVRRRDRRVRPGRARARHPARAARPDRSTSSSGGPSRTRCRGRCTSTTRSARILQSCGIGDEPRPDLASRPRSTSGATPTGTTLLRFGRIGDRRVAAGRRRRCSASPTLEALLEARARALPTIDVRRGVEVDRRSTRTTTASRRRRRVRRPRGGRAQPLRGRLRRREQHRPRPRSACRSHDLGFFYDWLIVDVILNEPRVFDPINLQICDPARPTTVVSGGPGRRRWEFMRLPDEALDELNDEATRRGSCSPPGTCTPATPRSNATPSTRSTPATPRRWRGGRVFLAGDAAHLMPPFAGQGMCSGLRDAANLAWKLDLVLGGDTPRRRCSTRYDRGAAAERAGGDRALDGARQGHLRARPGRSGGP